MSPISPSPTGVPRALAVAGLLRILAVVWAVAVHAVSVDAVPVDAVPVDAAPVDARDRVRVMVWNAWRGGNEVDRGPEKILEVIRCAAPDLVLMQESYDIEGDRPTLGRWVAERLGWHAHQGQSPHLCVLSRRPFKSTFIHHPWHGVGARIEDEAGRAFVAWDIWLDYRAYISFALRDAPAISDQELLACETTGSSRRAEVGALLEAVAREAARDARVPVLVGGDFNCPSHLDWTRDTARVYRNRRALPLPVSLAMRDAGFRDAFRAVHADPVQHPGITWSPMFRQADGGAEQGFERIDRLYLRNPEDGPWTLEARSAFVLPDGWDDEAIRVRERVFPSDHGALVVDLEWIPRADDTTDAGDCGVPTGQSIGFADEVATLVARSRAARSGTGGTVLVGSSIFRLWSDAEADLREFQVRNHGFGGARTWELLAHADELVVPFAPETVVVYCGSNDVNAGEPADAIVARLDRFTRRIEAALPGVRVMHVSINRAPQKRDRWEVVDEANAAIRRMCAERPNRTYLDVNAGLIDADGSPRDDLYLDDGLHFKPEAYRQAFLPVVRAALDRYRPSSSTAPMQRMK